MSIRIKLIIGLFVIILIFNLVLALLTSWYVGKVYFQEVQTRVELDLNYARDIYNNSINRIEEILKAISIRRSNRLPIEEEVKGELGQVLKNLYHDIGLDILTLIGPNGKVLYRAHNPQKKGDNLSKIPIIQKVLKTGRPAKGTIVLSRKLLENESQDLADQAFVNIKKTPKARTLQKKNENRGMIITAAVPFRSLEFNSSSIKYSGILMGGILLNNNFEIVDKIKSDIFQNQQYKNKDIGTATIFFDDLRISTNVRGKDTQRAVGSRMSFEVYDSVINNDKTWADRAFVVNDWYITAYEPIYNLNNKIIGALYVGLLERPFKQPQKIILLFFFIIVGVSIICSFILIFFYTKKLLKPIDNIIKMSNQVIKGDLTARCDISAPGEMGMLCNTIDQMAYSIQQREEELQRITQQKISQSDKLASIGRLSAGIAHEINNPLTGVLTFAHLLKEKKNNSAEDFKDIEIIIRETTRVRDIVKGLLDFAKQTPFEKQLLNINDLISQILNLTKNQREFKNIFIKKDLQETLPRYYGDKNQLQQVFLNLILNAAEAIPNTGTIDICTYLKEEKIHIKIKDTGCGIKKENLEKIFDPFYTSKPVGQGTGLGLSISYGIIHQHGGTIHCTSIEGEGTNFDINLPIQKTEDE